MSEQQTLPDPGWGDRFRGWIARLVSGVVGWLRRCRDWGKHWSERARAHPFRAVLAVLAVGGAISLLGYIYERYVFVGLWTTTSVAYDPACLPPDSRCEDIRYVAAGHNVHPPLEGGMVRLSFDPRVNDPIAQWGDCLERIMRCVRGEPLGETTAARPISVTDRAGVVNDCVARARPKCPAKCIRRYQSDTGPTIAQAERALFSVFVERTAVCRPSEPMR